MPRVRPPALPEVTISELEGVRYLHLGSPWVQGAMRLRKPDRVELEYVRRMLCGLLFRPSEVLGEGRAVQLGLGAAALTRFCAQALGMATEAVELNPAVIRVCRQYFRLPLDGPGLQVHCADAGAWIAHPEQRASIDLLQVDLYDHEAAAPVLDDPIFYAHCRAALRPGGVMTVNLFGRQASFERSAEHLEQAFGRSQLWRMQATREGNTVVVAGRQVVIPDRQSLTERAQLLEDRLGVPARRWLRMIRPL